MGFFKVFISHTNGPEDMTVVRRLASNLQMLGVTAYIAEDDRRPGKYLSRKIQENIQSSDWVIGLWTDDASKSAYVNQELGFAWEKVPVAPLVQRGIKPKGFLEGQEYISFDPEDSHLGIKEMAEFIGDEKFQMEMDKADKAFWIALVASIAIALGVIGITYLLTKKE